MLFRSRLSETGEVFVSFDLKRSVVVDDGTATLLPNFTFTY